MPPPSKPKTDGRAPFELNGMLVKPGERLDTHIETGKDPLGRILRVPCHILHGKGKGPTLAITAAIHGDELNGVSILHHIIHGDDHIPDTPDDPLSATELNGTLILIPIANPEGVLLGTRHTPDGRDLNRQFPGNPQGNQSQRLAHILFSTLVKRADYLVDLHTAPGTRENLPHVRADLDNAACKEMARAFGTNVVLHSKGISGTLRHEATTSGCPAILLETGTSNAFQYSNVRQGVAGVLNLLRSLEMIDGEVEQPDFRVLVRTSRWIRAPSGGLLHEFINVGQLVKEGQLLAHITDPFGGKVEEISSPVTGLVVSVATTPLVRSGDPLVHIVVIQKTLQLVEKALGKYSSPDCTEEVIEDAAGEPLDDMVFTSSEKSAEN